MNKISSMLDAVADSLEAKGYLKEAHEIDKVADAVEKIAAPAPAPAPAQAPAQAPMSFKDIPNVDSLGVYYILQIAKKKGWVSYPREYSSEIKQYALTQHGAGKTTVDIMMKGDGQGFTVTYNTGNPEIKQILNEASKFSKTIHP